MTLVQPVAEKESYWTRVRLVGDFQIYLLIFIVSGNLFPQILGTDFDFRDNAQHLDHANLIREELNALSVITRGEARQDSMAKTVLHVLHGDGSLLQLQVSCLDYA